MWDRRTGQRSVTLKTGKIAMPNSASTLDCAIFNISARGALIVVTHPGAITEYFNMMIEQTGTTYTCRRVWSEGHRLGVLFGAAEADLAGVADIEWLPAPQLREHYVDPIATDMSAALYLAQIGGGGLRKITTNEPDAALADPLIACGPMKKPTLAVS